jgi:hypothetical protein
MPASLAFETLERNVSHRRGQIPSNILVELSGEECHIDSRIPDCLGTLVIYPLYYTILR